MDDVLIPRDVIKTIKYVTLEAVVMFVNNLLFVIMYGRGIV